MSDFVNFEKEVLQIEKNIITARGIIADGISRYKKKKLKLLNASEQ